MRRSALALLTFGLLLGAMLTWPGGGLAVAADEPKSSALPIPRNRMTHDGTVYSVAYSPDGKTLASGSYDKTIKLWDVKTGTERASLNGHTRSVGSVAYRAHDKTLAS